MKRLLISGVLALTALTAAAQPQLRKDNIDEILQALTLEEKVNLLVGVNSDPYVAGVANGTRPVERLGIPPTIFTDGPAGVRIDPNRDPEQRVATGFPVGTLIASSWDTEMVERMTAAMGNEVLEYGIDALLAPGMNIHRNPLCGRNFEYFSEDPVLSGKIAAAYVRGIQSNGVGATVKHFAANNQETNRTGNDALISQRALREIYLKNFEIAVKEGKPWAVMSSYNALNGDYTQQKRELLTTVLKEEWGFPGIVMTDWGFKEGTVKAVNAGNDVMEPGSEEEYERILAGVRDGRISEEQLDANVRRVLEFVVKTNWFRTWRRSDVRMLGPGEMPGPDLKAHAAVAREAAAESIILLRNDRRTLPLTGDEQIALYGTAALHFIAGGTGSGEVHKPYVVNLTDALQNAGFKLDKKLEAFYRDWDRSQQSASKMEREEVTWENVICPEAPLTASSIEVQASANDVAVVVLGRNAGEGRDRTLAGDFELSEVERDLLRNVSEAFHARGKRMIVALNIGGVIETASWKHSADAILLPWSPGQEGANAVADILKGAVNPSGKLPMTFPNNYRDVPSAADFPYDYDPYASFHAKENVDYTFYSEDIWVGYRYYQTEGKDVSYPFGFGLSYTSFAYSKPVVKADKDGFTASVTVTNTGPVAGKEVVELYVAAPAGGLEKPVRELKAFAKTKLLQPGENQVLTMTVDNYSLASFNENTSSWEAAAGAYEVQFCASVEDIRAAAPYTLKKALAWPVHDVLSIQGGDAFPAVEVTPAGRGLSYTYHEGDFMSVKEVTASKPVSEGIAPSLSAALKQREDHFGLVFTGLLKIDRGGVYQLSMVSDDGAVLYLDGRRVLDIDRDGGGSASERAKLEAGFHRIRVEFFDNYMEEFLRVGLKGPGVSAENIPSSMLYHE
jgi:beta-glucosidase